MKEAAPIIVIEDRPQNRHLLRDLFRRLKYRNTVLFFSNPIKALQYLSHSPSKPLLLLSDIRMQETEGFNLLNEALPGFVSSQLSGLPYIIFSSDMQSPVDAMAAFK